MASHLIDKLEALKENGKKKYQFNWLNPKNTNTKKLNPLNRFNALPEELIWIILTFAGIDKKSNMNKVLEQFIKGGFNRKNLKLQPYLDHQHRYAKQFWLSARPELSGSITEWNYITSTNEACPFEYMNGEWSIKWKMVRVTFTRSRWVDGNLVQEFRQKQSSKNPVSKWLKNIEKFETVYPEFAKMCYLPIKTRDFKVKKESNFYIKKKKKKGNMKIREYEKKAAEIFINQRRTLKYTQMFEKFGFKLQQLVVLQFKLEGELKPVKYRITSIYLTKPITRYYGCPVLGYNRISTSGRCLFGGCRKCLFQKPRGHRRFEEDAVDKYLGIIKIGLRRCGNYGTQDHYYTPEDLLSRII